MRLELLLLDQIPLASLTLNGMGLNWMSPDWISPVVLHLHLPLPLWHAFAMGAARLLDYDRKPQPAPQAAA
jgi:hypothetical protein